MVSTTQSADEGSAQSASPRARSTGHKATRVKREVTRFTLDLDPEQHRFLRLFAVQNGIKASLVMRTLIYILETNIDVATRVIEEIYSEQDSENTQVTNELLEEAENLIDNEEPEPDVEAEPEPGILEPPTEATVEDVEAINHEDGTITGQEETGPLDKESLEPTEHSHEELIVAV